MEIKIKKLENEFYVFTTSDGKEYGFKSLEKGLIQVIKVFKGVDVDLKWKKKQSA